ncbi:MAG: hypothetical protein Q8904_10445 [Bacteroidota bacterium]|nr:hypothetical protein [Bacteroidota bacterium]
MDSAGLSEAMDYNGSRKMVMAISASYNQLRAASIFCLDYTSLNRSIAVFNM